MVSTSPAGVEHVEQPAKLRAIGLLAARHFAEDFFASGLGELAHLGVNALAVRRCWVAKNYALKVYAWCDGMGLVGIRPGQGSSQI
jgi:hypothetical protein